MKSRREQGGFIKYYVKSNINPPISQVQDIHREFESWEMNIEKYEFRAAHIK